MDHLSLLENRSIYVIREAYHHFPDIALMWSIGKDSTTLLWLCRKAFFGELPFAALHIDTGCKFPEMYAFRDHYAREFGLQLIIHRNEAALSDGWNHDRGTLECCNQLKTLALKQAVLKHGFSALLLGIRRDEHGVRAKERVFSPRDADFRWDYENQPAELWNQYRSQVDDDQHVRVHPLLGWTERDVWSYIERESIPVNPLYFARNGERYRSLGCAPCTCPIVSEASTIKQITEELASAVTSERAGRAQDKESAQTMQKLRALGYM